MDWVTWDNPRYVHSVCTHRFDGFVMTFGTFEDKCMFTWRRCNDSIYDFVNLQLV